MARRGRGYRIYFAKDTERIVIVLGGGRCRRRNEQSRPRQLRE
jgi:putative component of toxin-antitoxin plasmid stabilization module